MKFADTDTAFEVFDRVLVDLRTVNATLASPEPVREDDMPISRMRRSPLPVSRHKSKGKRSAEGYAPVCSNNTLDPSTTISTQEPAPSWLTEYAASARTWYQALAKAEPSQQLDAFSYPVYQFKVTIITGGVQN